MNTKQMNTLMTLLLIVAVLPTVARVVAAEPSDTKAPPAAHRADWFHRAQWGSLTHYLVDHYTAGEINEPQKITCGGQGTDPFPHRDNP